LTKDRPTIMQIIPDLNTGGAELSAIEIASAVTESGGRAIVLSRGGRLEAELAVAGGELIRFPAATKNPARMIANAFQIARLIGREGAALIHARSRAPAWSALIAARHAGVPFVTTYHGAYAENDPLKRLYNSVMARGDIVIANSEYTAALIQERYRTPERRLRVIHRGVDLDRFDPATLPPERVAALRQAWGLAEGERAVLHPARLTSWKGQAVVIAAAEELRARGLLDGIVFILAGDTQGREGYRQSLREQIAASGLEQHVRIVGHVADMPAAFAASVGALVASTEPEAFGRTAAEAQAMGCPVIATAIGAPPETVLAEPAAAATETTGWLVAPGQPLALADALGALLALPSDALAALSNRARNRVRESFSLDVMKRKTLAVYDELLPTRLSGAFRRRSGI
jgi:glycosyltransferase involved in cell wall biosynthesis